MIQSPVTSFSSIADEEVILARIRRRSNFFNYRSRYTNYIIKLCPDDYMTEHFHTYTVSRKKRPPKYV